MSKIKYIFDPETLSFKKIELSIKEKVLKIVFARITPAIVLGIILFIVMLYKIDPPNERRLEITSSTLKLEYEVLNKQISTTQNLISQLQHRDDTYREVFEQTPIPNSVRNAGFGGVDRYARFTGYKSSNLVIETTKKIDKISKQIVIQSLSYDKILSLVVTKQKMLDCLPAICPISSKELTRLGSLFGYRAHPILGYVRMHYGVDLVAPKGTPVYAAGDGIVERSEYSGNGFGYNVIINHGYTYSTVYAHLHKLNVVEGQKIKRGDLIGTVGNTGLSTCDHLHYEVRHNNIPVDPISFYANDLSDEEYEAMLESASNENTHVYEK